MGADGNKMLALQHQISCSFCPYRFSVGSASRRRDILDRKHYLLPWRRSIVGCGSSPDFPGKLRFHMKDQRRPLSAVSVLLRIATDESFSSFYPKAHLPLSLMQNKPVYVELKLLEPSEPSMVLLVHSCLAYTPNPDCSWMRFYDSCSSRGISQLLPSSNSRHIRRIKINGLPPLPSKHFPYRTHVGHWNLEDPQIYILCLTEVCSTVHNDCRVRCGKGPNSDAKAMK